MPQFLAPKLQGITSEENSTGALNSGSVNRVTTPKSGSTVPLALSSGIPIVNTIRPARKGIIEAGSSQIPVVTEDGENKPRDNEDHRQMPMEDSMEEELSEEELRKLFEDEEIERFLRHFRAHVQEVRLPSTSGHITQPPNAAISDRTQGVILSSPNEDPLTIVDPGSDGEKVIEDSAWTMVDRSHLHSTEEGGASAPSPDSSSHQFTISEWIARKYILPTLPPLQPNPDHRFTIGRARLQAERFNLVTQPAYGRFFARMWRYASWRDRRASAWYCTTFWIIWGFDLLLPALFAVILYTLLRHRPGIFSSSYPTLKELRARRCEAARAEALGEEVEKRFATGPEFGIRDAWKLFRSVTKGQKKVQIKKRRSGKVDPNSNPEDASQIQLGATEGEDETVMKVEAQGESQAEKDIKRAILQAMSEIADLHERIKNIFLWRRPEVSKIYVVAFTILFLVTLLLPARYLAKATYFVGGFFFWFVPPVILGLPPQARARIPPALADAPTDAQYAMELIALRVACGESVVPANAKPSKKKKATVAPTEDAREFSKENDGGIESKDKEFDWGKWGRKAARGLAWAEEGKRVFKGDMPSRHGTWPPANPLVPPVALAHAQPNAEMETSTYPAQHTTGPGLLTLTSTTLFFTQVLASKPKVQIRLDHICGVKKSGKMGGLVLKWEEADDDEREEKFMWVGGRDEVFAKLVGWRGRRWIQV